MFSSLFCCSKLPEPNEIGRKLVLCYGDSNTAGFPPPKDSYAVFLEEELQGMGFDVEVEVNGNSGATAKDLYAKRDQSAIPDCTGAKHEGLGYRLDVSGKPTPDLIVIMLGTNGLGTGETEPEVLSHIVELHDFCHERGIKTIALAAVTIDTDRDQIMNDMKTLIQERDELAHDVELLDEADPMILGHLDPRDVVPRDPENWEKDELHFSVKGGQLLAENVAPLVADALVRVHLQT